MTFGDLFNIFGTEINL